MEKEILQRGPIFVRKSPIHGYGVFASEDIAAGDLVEECHSLFTASMDATFINHYFKANGQSALPLGYGCIYNHSDTPNVEYIYDSERELIVFTATRFIYKGEEIQSSYGEGWFASRNMKVKALPWWRLLYHFAVGWPLRISIVCAGWVGFTQILKHLAS